ncbi:hypothetical protein COO20_04495 [Thalassospira marina]|uniref:Uncharacterized protein n=2 Tax=Thalassospira marina TaxID=2048283 RepID=A0A2N3KXX9_9PROT|nr:hypothetical protein COO20_04495 [Thalassospira marina]
MKTTRVNLPESAYAIPTYDEQKANANLIAAAPDLLDVLRVTECAVEQLCYGQDTANECWTTLSKIRDVIAKAEGQL